MPLQGSGRGAGCHRNVPLNLLLFGDEHFWGVDLVPLQGAIVMCYGWDGGDDELFGEWTWCHCRVPSQGA